MINARTKEVKGGQRRHARTDHAPVDSAPPTGEPLLSNIIPSVGGFGRSAISATRRHSRSAYV